ncbi:peptidylprolyl isomerase [Novosphingobium aquimarinum]|uniref:peptidylprolyl isomerase n=1 Tax=Novosphingobium aquimarinum TaxID=2682494 RepID=UPI0012EC46FF|nr:peptidylprolyl isomerase [Novosphingobium aquimarinum]
MRYPVLCAALVFAAPIAAQTQPATPAEPTTPNEIVAAAPGTDWNRIAPEDLLVMDLAPDAAGRARRVVIQLLPAPFSQGWIDNMRKLARAKWWDGTSINRVQDNYVVQWGDPGAEDRAKAKALPSGLTKVPESDYTVDVETLAGASAEGAIADAVEEVAALDDFNQPSPSEQRALISIEATQTELASQGWHERDSYAPWVEFWNGWPLANQETGRWVDEDGNAVARPANTQGHILQEQKISRDVERSEFWPVHCYGYVGVGRDVSPDTGSGAELYAVIGQAPRHLDRNIAVVGRVIEGIEHLSALPRGTGPLGFYETPGERTAITAIRLGSDVSGLPAFEYLDTDSGSFAAYLASRANRKDSFYFRPAGGVDICNVPVPVRRVSTGD